MLICFINIIFNLCLLVALAPLFGTSDVIKNMELITLKNQILGYFFYSNVAKKNYHLVIVLSWFDCEEKEFKKRWNSLYCIDKLMM